MNIETEYPKSQDRENAIVLITFYFISVGEK